MKQKNNKRELRKYIKHGFGFWIPFLLFLVLAIAIVYAERLPVVDSDLNNWGTILNDFLLVSHTPNGTINDSNVITKDNTTWASQYGNVTKLNQLYCAEGDYTDSTIISADIKDGEVAIADLANDYIQTSEINNTDYSFENVKATNLTVVKNVSVNGLHIDKINSSHWKIWG